jgi:hypothetical protein
MDSQLKAFADALERILRGDLSAEHFRRQFPLRAAAPALERVLTHVEHFLSDADIREHDAAYKEMQEASMSRLIAALRLGDLATASSITFLHGDS